VLAFLPCAAGAQTQQDAKPESKPESLWKTPLPKGSRGIILMYEAVSGKHSNDETNNLLTGVTEIERGDNELVLHREDGAVLHLTRSTKLGAHYLDGISQSECKAREKGGTVAGDIVAGLSRISAQGNKIDVFREPEDVDIDVAKCVKRKTAALKEINLSHLSFLIEEHGEHPSIKEITGICVHLKWGLSWKIELKEFSREKNAEGNTVLTFGIKNPVPIPFRKALFMHDIIHWTYVAKKHSDVKPTT